MATHSGVFPVGGAPGDRGCGPQELTGCPLEGMMLKKESVSLGPVRCASLVPP